MSDRMVFGGATIMAACACGTSAGVASMFAQPAPPQLTSTVYLAIVGTGAVLFTAGIGARRWAWLPAALALGAFAVAGALAPPAVMRDGYAFSTANLFGFWIYPVMIALFVWTALALYRPSNPVPAALALAGVGLAAGCTCCLTPGAARQPVLSAGVAPAMVGSRPVLLSVAVVIAAAALIRSGQTPAIRLLLLGALVSYPIEAGVEWLVPTLTVGTASLTFLLRYPLWLAGSGLMIYAASRPLFAPAPAAAPRLVVAAA